MLKLKALEGPRNYFFFTLVTFAFLLPLSRAALSIFALILPLMWLIDASIKKSFQEDIQKLFSSWVIKLLFSYFLLMIVSLLWGEDNGSFWLTRAFMISFLLFITPVVIMRIRKEETSGIMSAFLLGMLVSEIVSYGIYFGWWHYKNISPTDPSPFMMHIEYSVLLAFSSLLILTRIIYAKSIKSRLIYIIFFMTVTINLFINGGRTGQIAFFIAIFIVTTYGAKHRIRTLFTTLAVVVAISWSAWSFSDTFHNRIQTAINQIEVSLEKGDYSTSAGVRVGSYLLAYEVIKENPLLGAGWVGHQPLMVAIAYGDENVDIANVHDEKLLEKIAKARAKEQKSRNTFSDMRSLVPYIDFQNQYLFVWAQFGIIGLILFLALLYKIAKLKLLSQDFINIKITYLSIMLLYFLSEALIHQFIGAFSALIIGLLVVQASPEPSKR